MPKRLCHEELPKNIRGKVKFLSAQYATSIILVFSLAFAVRQFKVLLSEKSQVFKEVNACVLHF
jgi:hypothetical protein